MYELLSVRIMYVASALQMFAVLIFHRFFHFCEFHHKNLYLWSWNKCMLQCLQEVLSDC